MKKILGLLCLVLLGVTSSVCAEVEVSSTTLFNFYEQSAPGFDDKFKAPAYEFLRADMEADNGLGFHIYGWGNVYLDDIGDGEDADFTYGYLSYRTEKSNALVKAGRVYEYLITGIEQLDGISARADLAAGFNASAFVGSPSQTPDDNKGDFIYGGQLNWRNRYLQLGASAVNEDGAWTENIDESANRRQLVGGMFVLAPLSQLMATGNLSYNLVTEDLAEERYLLSIMPMDKLTVTGEYREVFFEDYFATTSMPVFTDFEAGKEKTAGGSVTLQATKAIDLSAFYRHFDLTEEGEADEDGSRYGAQFRVRSKIALGAVQYQRSDGNTAELSYDEVSAYVQMQPNKTVAIGINGLMHLYDEPIFDTDTGYLVGANLNFNLSKNLALNSSLSYENNPRFDEDVKGFIWLKYDFNI